MADGSQLPPGAKLAYTVREAAAALGVDADEMRRIVRRGSIASFKWCGTILIRADVLASYHPAAAPQPADIPTVSGVYMLYREGGLVYVGRSGTLRTRLGAHRHAGRDFDEVRAIPCDPERAAWLEAELIRVLRPPENLIRFVRRATVTEAVLAAGGIA